VVLVDTSVWVSHLREGNAKLEALLNEGMVVCHPFIIGELACGTMRNRAQILSLLQSLPTAEIAEHSEVLLFIERNRLVGKGLGYVDVHLLASAVLTDISLWTLDRKLQQASARIGLQSPWPAGDPDKKYYIGVLSQGHGSTDNINSKEIAPLGECSTEGKASMKKMKRGKVFFIGAGPGDPELLTLKAKRIIGEADVLIYAGSLVNPKILTHKKSEAISYDSASMDLKEIMTIISREIKKGRAVARIHSGDPAIYGAIREQIALLEKKGIPYEIIPGVSSVFAAAAALKKELTVPELSQTIILTRISGRTKVPPSESIDKLAQPQATMAIFLSITKIEKVVSELQTSYPPDTPVAVVYKASWPDEKIIKGTLATIVEKVHKSAIKRQTIILVGKALDDGVIKTRSKLYDEGFTHGFRKDQRKKKEKIAIVALTKSGAQLGTLLKKKFPHSHLYLPEKLIVKGARVKSFSQDLGMLFG